MPTLKQDLTELKAFALKEIHIVQTDFLPIAVTITEYANQAEGDGVLDAIALGLSDLTGGLSVEINNEAKILITKAIAIELDLEAVPDNATPEQLGATATAIDTAVTGLAPKPKSQFFTTLGVAILNVFKKLTGQAESPTYAEDVIAVQTAYLKLKSALTAPVEPVTQGNEVPLEGKAAAELAQG